MNYYIIKILDNDPYITKLDLSNEGFFLNEITALSKALETNTKLEELNISGNEIEVAGATALAEALKKNSTLIKLDISINFLEDGGATVFADALKQNRTLITLNITANRIGHQGARALAEALKENSTLTQLLMYNNNIRDEGAIALADVLKQNRTLNTLDIANNHITKVGLAALAEALKQNSTLTKLEKWGNETGIRENVLDRYIERNLRGHARAKASVSLLREFATASANELRQKYAQDQNNLFSTLLLTPLIDRKSYFTGMANNLEKTRSDPIWWTKEERAEAGLQTAEEALPSAKRSRVDNINSCIQCISGKAKFYEKGTPTRLFCGSYCQWIKHTGTPDLRGKTPQQIVEIFQKRKN
jgi:Leucine Rich repeat